MDDRIRVNTDELNSKSKDFESSAGVFSQAGNEILSVAAGLPSYEGQLSGPARAAALEINRQCQDLRGSSMNLSQSLARTAQAFEDVDNQAIMAFNKNQAALSGNVTDYDVLFCPAPTIKIHGGNQYFGYKYLSNNVVEIWCQGRSMTIDLNAISSEDWKSVMDFINKVEAFDSIVGGFPDELKDVIQGAFITFVGILTAGVLVETIIGAIAGGVLIGKGIYEMVMDANKLYENCEKIIDAYNKSVVEFNKLINSQDPGIQIKP